MKQHITVRRGTLWIILYYLGSSFLLLPSAVTSIAKQDAWISILVSIGLQLLLIPIYVRIAQQMKGRSPTEYIRDLLGKWTGNILMLIFLITVPFLIFMMTLRNLGDFYSSSISPDTPEEAVFVLIAAAVLVAVRSGVTAIGRSSEILFWIIPLLFLLVTLTLIPDTELQNLLPVYEFGWQPIFHASLMLFSFPYLETVLMLYLLPYFRNAGEWRRSVVLGTLVSGSMFFIMVLHMITVLGAGVISNLTYASYFIVRTISIADFLERFEIIVSVFWYISIFFRLTLLMFIISNGLSNVFRMRESSTLTVPILVIAVLTAKIIWPDQSYLLEINRIWPLYAACFGIIMPIVIWIIGVVRKR